MAEKKKKKINTYEITLTALFIAIITVCSWISIPLSVPFTLQTFAVFSCLLFLGGKNGVIAILGYILLGAVGVPVFSGFRGGLSALLGATGGYILGFLLTGLIYWLLTAIFKEKTVIQILSLLLGLAACYAFGTAWFMYIYGQKTGPIGLTAALGMCVIPFIIPDLIKLLAAFFLVKKLKPIIQKNR